MKHAAVIGFGIYALVMITFAAQAHEDHEHREHGAHVHGSAKLDIAFDNLTGKVEFKGASNGVVGFEHAATSAKDKKILKERSAKFEKDISKMIQFDGSLGCEFKKDQIDMIAQDEKSGHSDFVANFTVTCKKSVLGSQLKIDFASFAGLRDVDVTVLVGELQKSAEYKGKAVTVELK